MENLIVKSVNVMGDTVMAAKDSEGIIWVGIKWMCQGMGMSEGHYKRQIKNIQKDLLLKDSGANLTLNKGSGEREVFCLKLDYLPIWLSKISITPTIQKDHPELADKLLNYQLKAKDILAEAFLPNGGKIPQTIPEQIQLLAQGNVELNKRVDAVSTEVKTVKEELQEFKETLPLLPEDADELSNLIKKRGVTLLGGKESQAYNDRNIRQTFYCNYYAHLKYNFGGISSYKSIKRNQKAKAVEIIEKYEPPLFLKERIDNANAQQRIDFEGGAGE